MGLLEGISPAMIEKQRIIAIDMHKRHAAYYPDRVKPLRIAENKKVTK
jgi:hypothetical protein